MLGKQGILTGEESRRSVACLKEILADVEAGRLVITDEYEDIHSFVEANLIDRLGDTGKKRIPGAAQRPGGARYASLHQRRAAPCGCALKGTARHDIAYHGAEYGDDHAGFHTPAESSADHARASHGGLF